MMSVGVLERGRFCYGSSRLFSALKDSILQPFGFSSINMKVSFLSRVSRSYALSAVERASEVSSNEVSSSHKHWENFMPFPSMIEQRRKEAQRSIIVEVQSQASCCDLVQFCNTIGPTRKTFYYSVNSKSYMLLEFKTIEIKEEVLKNAGHSMYSKIIPVSSSYLWFKQSKEGVSNGSVNRSVNVTNTTKHTTCDENSILEGLQNHKTVEDQMHFIHNSYKVSDFSTRLRFLTCNQIERALSGVFPNARAYPFGSSVSGFGRNSADLDIFLQFLASDSNQALGKHRLIFHAKSWRDDTNLQLKFVGDLLSVLLPACTNVRSIMGARVPIIKYQHTITNMECDVQNSSASGVDMTHILWIMCNWDKRVAPLVYTLRYWAKVNKVTNDMKPSPFITNFNLIILIIYFLQVENILPTLNFLEKSASHITSVRYDSNLQINFLQDIRQLPGGLWTVSSNPSVHELLLKFFEFYSSFPFESKGISIIDGKDNSKPDSKAMWVVNPLYPSLNTTRNVNKTGVSMFQKMVRDSHSLLTETVTFKSNSIGLLSLIPDYRRNKDNIALNAALTTVLSESQRLNANKSRTRRNLNELTATESSKRVKMFVKNKKRM